MILSVGEFVASASLSRLGPTNLISAMVPWLPAILPSTSMYSELSELKASSISIKNNVWSENTRYCFVPCSIGSVPMIKSSSIGALVCFTTFPDTSETSWYTAPPPAQ